MILRGYTLVTGPDGRRHRRYLRWDEVDPALRTPEEEWPWRWRTDEGCAVAVIDRTPLAVPCFRPCERRRLEGMNLCVIHGGAERRSRKPKGRDQRHASGGEE